MKKILTTTRKRKKRRTGSSLLNFHRLWIALALALALTASASGKEKGKQAPSYGVVAGTVFREPGFALPGAEVTLTPDESSRPKTVKVKRMKAVTDSRGEYAFRVPAAPVRYTVSVKAKGFLPEEKQAEIQGEERVDIFFQLKAEGGQH
jgi:hypothetical protein